MILAQKAADPRKSMTEPNTGRRPEFSPKLQMAHPADDRLDSLR